MKKNKFDVSIISLAKNNYTEFLTTANSIGEQKFDGKVEWIVIDGSNSIDQRKIKLYVDNFNNTNSINIKCYLYHEKDINIKGLYPSMNYGLKIFSGASIIFMNSGDTFYSNTSIQLLYYKLKTLTENKSFVFGQARIISESSILWFLPGRRLNNIDLWIKFFRPNHQSMLVSRDLALKFLFNEECLVVSDDIWKKNIIRNAKSWKYINSPVCNFSLGGISSKRPKLSLLKNQLKNNYISIFRKILILIKFFIPPFFFHYYSYIQKAKSLIIDLLL